MAIIYVDSGAGGANDGTSWTDAYVLWQSALTNATTSDVIYMEIGHQETVATSITYTCTNATINIPIPTYLIDSIDDSYSPTAGTAYNLQTTGSSDITLVGNMHIYGPYFDIGRQLISIAGGQNIVISDGKIRPTQYILIGSNFGDSSLKFRNTELASNGTLECRIQSTYMPDFMIGGSVTGTVNNNGFILPNSGKSQVVGLTGVDLSGITNTPKLVNAAVSVDTGFRVFYADCDYFSGHVLVNALGADTQIVESYQGGDTNLVEVFTFRGVVTEDTATYLNGGYQPNGSTNPVSREIAPNSTAGRVTHVTPTRSIAIPFYYNDTVGSSVTYTVEIVENYTVALTDADCWSELCYYGTASSPLYAFDRNQDFIGTGTALAAGTGLANWTGEPAGSRSVKLTHTVTPQVKGLYLLTIYLGKYEAGKQLFYNSEVASA